MAKDQIGICSVWARVGVGEVLLLQGSACGLVLVYSAASDGSLLGCRNPMSTYWHVTSPFTFQRSTFRVPLLKSCTKSLNCVVLTSKYNGPPYHWIHLTW